MKKNDLKKLWTALGLATSYYAINSWLMSQGMKPLLPGTLIDDRAVPGAYFASIIVSIMLIFVVKTGKVYIEGKENLRWYDRVPTVFFEDIDYNKRIARRYQLFFIFIILLMPAFSLIHFNNKVLSHGDILDTKQKIVFEHNVFKFSSKYDLLELETYQNRYCMGQDLSVKNLCTKKDDYQGGITWIPIVSPLIMIILSFVSLYQSLLFSLQIFKKPKIT